MAKEETDHEQILEFVHRCRDEHIAPYPVGTCVVNEHTGLTMYRVRTCVGALLSKAG